MSTVTRSAPWRDRERDLASTTSATLRLRTARLAYATGSPAGLASASSNASRSAQPRYSPAGMRESSHSPSVSESPTAT